jgi:ferric-dicitrate binding protein FerR (iron transport regulator)
MKKLHKEELKTLMKRRQECLAAFNRWEAVHRERLSAAEAIRRISEIYEMLPEEAKKKDLNAKIEGIRRMHKAFSVIGRTRP